MYITYRRIRRSIMGLEPGTLNVLQLAIGFLFVFFAFNSQGFIEQTVIDDNKDKVSEHAGYISQAIIYAIFTLANFIAAPIVGLLGARWSLVGGALTYGIFQAGFLFLNEPFLYISSALIGVGAAVIWTAQGKYIAMNSNDETASKHSSLFWGISQICIAGGGIFLYSVFRDMPKDADDKYHITDSKVKTVYGVFTAVTAVGVVILGLVRMKKTDILVESTESEEAEHQLTFVELIKSTLQLFLTKRMLFMCVVFAYTGFELTFWSGIYPTSISFTQKLGKNTLTLLAFNAIAQGLGQATAGFLFGILGSKMKFFGRIRIVLLGWIIHLLVFIAVYINFPSNAPLKKTDDEGILKPPSQILAIICGYFLGFGDACWNTQIFSFLVTKYNKQSAEAFSLFKFFQSLTAAIGFGYGTSLVMEGHLIILIVTGIAGIICFVIAERIPTKLADE